MAAKRTRVFVCYCRNDVAWLERLRVHLVPLERQGLIEAWDDTRISAGSNRREAIDRALDEAGVAVLLVSASWAASAFIQDVELPRLLERARAEGVRVLPLLVSACQIELTPLAGLQFVNDTDQPLNGLAAAAREALLVQTAKTVMEALGSSAQSAAPPAVASTVAVLPAAAPFDPQQAQNELTQLLKQRFRQSERESLLFRLGLHPEDVKLRPEDREEFARAMVQHADNQGRLADLWDEVSRERAALLRGRSNPFR